jgi:3-oxoacyl-(acyl-carrier-protein) synthase/acyl carrier protein
VFVPLPSPLTALRDRSIAYRTGDRVRWYADGEIEFGGRMDFQVKLRGQRIELGEIENVLREQPGIVEAVVLLCTDSAEPALVAYVYPASIVDVPDDGMCNALPCDRVAAVRSASNSLPAYMVPSLVVGVDDWPRTSSGKIDRRRLPNARAVSSGSSQVRNSSVSELVLRHVCVTLPALAAANVDVHSPLVELGLSSMQAVLLMRSLSDACGTVLRATMCFDYPTVSRLAAAIDEQLDASGDVASRCSALERAGAFASNAVAFDGTSALMPCGAASARAVSRLVGCCCDAISEVPVERWDACAAFDGLAKVTARGGRHGGFARSIALFDDAAFAISRAEAYSMDPAQRLLLERGYAALQCSQQDRSSLEGSLTGVFLGILRSDYAQVLAASPASRSVYAATSTASSVASGRLAYVLGLHGQCTAYDTACSAALVACHAGLRAMQLGEGSLCVVAGVNLMFTPSAHIRLAAAGMTSSLGRCHTFDRRADGYARGEAIVTLTLVQAAEGLVPLPSCVVRQDGRSATLTAPKGQAQQGLLMVAHARAGTSADAVVLHEAHGTGTALGDPIELGSLVDAVLDLRSHATDSVLVGSMKANIGHAEACAGAAGLLKLVEELQAPFSSPNAQLRALNENLEALLHGTRNSATLSTQLAEFGARPLLKHAHAVGGVSSFGYSGTIAHALLHGAWFASRLRKQTRLLTYRRRTFAWHSDVRFLRGDGGGAAASNSHLHSQLVQTPSEVLLTSLQAVLAGTTVDPDTSLVQVGLDSLAAQELLVLLDEKGFTVPFERLIGGLSLRMLESELVRNEASGNGPTPQRSNTCPCDSPLAFSQQLWLSLNERGWGAWPNISLCVSASPTAVSAGLLCAAAQALCDINEALRTHYLQGANGEWRAQTVPAGSFQLPLELAEAPVHEVEAMRLASAFEARPFDLLGDPPVRALVLSAPSTTCGAQHWLCLSVHHVNADDASLRALHRQLTQMVASGELLRQQAELRFSDCAVWQRECCAAVQSTHLGYWRQRLEGAALGVPAVLAEPAGNVESLANFTLLAQESRRLSALAQRLGITASMLYHLLLSIVVARLHRLDSDGPLSAVVCHVVTSREQFTQRMRDVVGGLDTSVPVRLDVRSGETLLGIAVHTRVAFAEAHGHAAFLPRGDFMRCAGREPHELFELMPHINVMRRAASTVLRSHALSRVEQTRWGLLMRVHLLPGDAVRLQVTSCEWRVAALVGFCVAGLLRRLDALGADADECDLIAELDAVLRRGDEARAQVVRAQQASQVPGLDGDAFIWHRLLDRQQRWFEHNRDGSVCRDQQGRFVPTPSFPFPFAQLDKLAERRFLEARGVPLPKLLAVLSSPAELLTLALPSSWVVKPVGAGHSDGVVIVHDGHVLSHRTGSRSLDLQQVVADLFALVDAGGSWHNGKFFAWNVSQFLVEELVIDERGNIPPSDLKLAVLGEVLLWAEVHFRVGAQRWLAFVDENFHLLPPALNPRLLSQRASILICTEAAQLPRRFACWGTLVQSARSLGRELSIFARLDWYADVRRGPLMGELTLFPSILQPRNMYSPWANVLVRRLWRGLDGCAAERESDGSSTVTPNALEPTAPPPSPKASLLELVGSGPPRTSHALASLARFACMTALRPTFRIAPSRHATHRDRGPCLPAASRGRHSRLQLYAR